MEKDGWDKAEIVGKVAGAVLIPSAVAVSVFLYNKQANERATAAQMAQIAVGILNEEPKDTPDSRDALRAWAIDVLVNPSEITPLSQEAARQLQTRNLTLWNFKPWFPDAQTEAKLRDLLQRSEDGASDFIVPLPLPKPE